MLRLLLLITGLLSFSTFANNPNPVAVSFNIAGQMYTFDRPVRLATVLSLVPAKPDYRVNAAVFQLNDPQVEQQRSAVLKQIAGLIREQSKGSPAYQQLTALYQQIGSWQLMRRLNVVVDYDQARLNPKRNPQFNEGEYYIRLKSRADTIKVSGMVAQATSVPFKNGLTVTDYLNHAQLGADAHRDIVYLLEPDGDIKKLGIAYWNRQYVQPMPGSEIFVPLQDSLFFDRIGKLNDSIAKLMMHRM